MTKISEANIAIIKENKKMKQFIKEVVWNLQNGGYDEKTVFGKLHKKGSSLLNTSK